MLGIGAIATASITDLIEGSFAISGALKILEGIVGRSPKDGLVVACLKLA